MKRPPAQPDADARPRRAGRGRRAGTVLIVTIWVLVVVAGMVLVLARAMRVEAICSANDVAMQQAAAVEQGAIQYVVACLDGLGGLVPSEANSPSAGVQIGCGAFWILRPSFEDDSRLLYGIVDEASKLNVNTATADMMSMLLGMTPEMAAAVVDWRDADGNIATGGAESEYYLLLEDPYECKNAPLETVEELLLVKMITPDILYGEDTNRNGALDENEDDADLSEPPDNRNGKLDRGIYDLVTVYSVEPGTSSSGSQRVNVNQASTRDLSNVLQKAVSSDRLADVLDRAQRRRPFQNVLDFYFRAELTIEEFQAVAGQLTTSNEKALRGLVNVNTAPEDVLCCLPGLDDTDVAALVTARSARSTEEDIAWVAEALPREKAVAIGSYITSRSYQFSADIVSVCGDGRAFRRCRIVVDARESPPRVLYRQDLTPLGWPLAPEILQGLRAGAGLEEVLEAVGQEVR